MLKPIYVDVGVGQATNQVQPDWNQNNPAKNDYIKNRPFYTYFDPIQQKDIVVPIESKYLLYAAPEYSLKDVSTDLSTLQNLYLLIYNSLDSDYSRYSLSTIIDFIENIIDDKIENNEIISELQSSLSDLQTAVENLQSTVESIQGTVEELQSSVSDVQDTVSGIEDDISNIEDTVDGMEDTVTELQSTVEDVQDTISNVEDDISDIQDNIINIQDLINDLDRRVTELEQSQIEPMDVDTEGYLVIPGAYVDDNSWLILGSNYYVDEEHLLTSTSPEPVEPEINVDSDSYLVSGNSSIDENERLDMDAGYYVDENDLLTM